MAKPIRITGAMKQQAQAEFAEMLADLKMSDGKIRANCHYRDMETSTTFTSHGIADII
jgi:hypothetical protein